MPATAPNAGAVQLLAGPQAQVLPLILSDASYEYQPRMHAQVGAAGLNRFTLVLFLAKVGFIELHVLASITQNKLIAGW